MTSSRRSFLSTSLLLPGAAAAFQPQSRTKRFPKPESIRYDSNCFTINGADTFIFSLEFPYPRIPRELWRDRFLKIKRAGFNTVDTYVFWNYHERQEGHFEFSNLEEFINLAKEHGLWVILRPGPYVDAEFERGAFPYWIIARRFPVRSMHPESLKTAKYWYDHVLPVIRRHQVTAGGPVILMQLENELDFTRFGESEQREYIRFLARTAWDAGIEVPLITNVTTVVRDRSDPDMKRLLDVCDFYPRWAFLVDREVEDLGPGATLEQKVAQSDRAVLATIRKMHREQPDCPLAIGELGTGYYSKFGGKLSEDEEGTEPEQTNALSKTIIEQGATYFNYYLGCGGTNFEWAAKGVTTTYDFAAPIRECGGLWEKYYVVRGVGSFLEMFGKMLTRSRMIENAGHSTNPDVSVTERVSGDSGFVFVRANTVAEHHFKLTFRDPASAANFTVPREGVLTLGPHAMKILAVQVPVAGCHLRYSTAELLVHGSTGDRNFVILCDEPGNAVELCWKFDSEPQVAGAVRYRIWDQTERSLTLGLFVDRRETFLLLDGRLLIALIPRHTALRTWTGQYPRGAVPFLTDAYAMGLTGSEERKIWADLDFLPGDHALTVLLPSKPAVCRVNGAPTEIRYDNQWRAARFEISIPRHSKQGEEIKQVQVAVETFDPQAGKWVNTPARVLEELGAIPYGYVKYKGQIQFNNEEKMYISAFTDDGKKIFINGKYAPEASKADKFVEVSPAKYLQPGTNTIAISYELFGSTEFGDEVQMAELKGIQSVHLSNASGSVARVEHWDIQTFSPAMRGPGAIDPEFFSGSWKAASLDSSRSPAEFVPAFTWCRAEFKIQNPQGWAIPRKLVFEASRDALIYLNGKFIGRSVTAGPQTEFYLPDSFLNDASNDASNIVTVLLAYTDGPGVIQTFRVEPYEQYSARRCRIDFEW